jgi:hypothetical protein
MSGPITMFDKSALEALNADEALWFDNFYRTTITPLFFVETLADLEKEVAAGRSPEQVVGAIASKVPVQNGLPNVHHRALAIADLLGHHVRMDFFPIISGGKRVATKDEHGIVFDDMPEFEAFQRWQDGEFLDVERRFAVHWRQALSGLDLHSTYTAFHRARGHGLSDFVRIKAEAERLLKRDGRRYQTLMATLKALNTPPEIRARILARWRAARGPALHEFAPYAAHVMTVDLVFNLAVGADLISRDRPSNKIDMAYLYYLPFSMIFVSSDKLHARAVPPFLASQQMFISGADLKQDLAAVDEHYSELPADVRARGIYEFAAYPPHGDYLVTALWDRYLPRWRENEGRKRETKMRPEAERKLIEQLDRMSSAPADTSGIEIDAQSADFVSIQRRVPYQRGKWQVLPPEVRKARD